MPKKTFDSQCSSTVRWKSEWQKVNKYVKTTRNKAALKFFFIHLQTIHFIHYIKQSPFHICIMLIITYKVWSMTYLIISYFTVLHT